MFRRVLLLLAALSAICPAAAVEAQTEVAAATTRATPPATASVYRIGPDDKLRMIIYGEEQLSGEYIVGGEGTISPPLIGAINVAGLTVAEAQARITQAYSASYVADPKVSIDVIEYRPFYILGEVNKAGQYPYRIGMTVMRAVATAEGFTHRANQKKVAIQGTDGIERVVPLDSRTQVQPGDTIRILERYF